jgi:peptide/nickel transport system substrate-binding protein
MVRLDSHDEQYASVNDLVQARIQGKLSRRQMLKRAAQLGIAAPVFGVMLHATNDMAFGAPSAGRDKTLNRVAQEGGQVVPMTQPTATEGAPQEGGQVVVGFGDEPDTLHPYLTALVAGSDIYQGVTEPLLKYDSNQAFVPALAESYEIGDDGMTYTFKLRQGVKFTDGSDFTAADVIASWNIIMDPEFGSIDQTGWRDIDTVDAPDPHTVVMKTKMVTAPFISQVGNFPICPKSAIDKGVDSFTQEYGGQPFGTGPFKVTEYAPKQHVILDKNAEYWGGNPHLDRIILQMVPDSNTFMVQLQTGEIDLAGSATTVGATQVDEALKIEGLTVYEHPTMAWRHLDIKFVGHLRRTKVRQALDFATPSQQIIDQMLLGRATPCIADQAPGTWAYNPNIQPRPFDLAQAEALLTEAGLTKNGDGVWEGPTPAGEPVFPGKRYDEMMGGGEASPTADGATAAPAFEPIDDVDAENLTGPVMPLEIELWATSGDDTVTQIIEVISAAWTQLGVKTSVNFQDVSTLWGPDGYQWNDKMTACMYSWFNSNDPDNQYYWSTPNIPSHPLDGGGNALAYFYPFSFQTKIDQMTEGAALETDQDKRAEMYYAIQELLHEEVPCIFMSWANAYPVAKNTIGGFWPSAFNRLLWNAHEWYIAQQ